MMKLSIQLLFLMPFIIGFKLPNRINLNFNDEFNNYNHLQPENIEKIEKMLNDKKNRYSPYRNMIFMKYKHIKNNNTDNLNITKLLDSLSDLSFNETINNEDDFENFRKFRSDGFIDEYGVFRTKRPPIVRIINNGGEGKSDEFGNDHTFEIIKNPTHNFSHIGGYEKIKAELMQTADILINYEKYKKYNVRTPKGIIFEGPPGNGKTLMAKGFCGEINASFIPVSGSEFSEKFVGVGASRVRELFKLALQNKPCIIFIDEIDAVARKRGNDAVSSNSEKDQTLNQLLINLDGFKNSNGIFLIGATNRIDLLDPALLRPGRMDKNIYIGNPDSKTRNEIIKIHLNGKPYDPSISLDYIVEMSGGLSGAQIENLLNEAMLNALRENREMITKDDLEYIINRIIAGWQSTESTFSENMIERIVIHEMGHACVGFFSPEHSNLVKVCLNLWSPKSPGYTVFENNDQDSNMYTKDGLISHLMVLLGGRIAEEIFYGYSVTTGAKKDLDQAYRLAHNMVLEYGMGKQNIYPTLSDQSKYLIDQEINSLLVESYDKAYKIVSNCKNLIQDCATLLKEKKVLKPENIINIIDDRHSYLWNIYKNK